MKVQISIRGRTYTLRSDEDEDLQAIARYVDRKMGEVAARSPRMDDYTMAMLAALNIASEFERFRREVDEALASLDRDLASTALLVDAGDLAEVEPNDEDGDRDGGDDDGDGDDSGSPVPGGQLEDVAGGVR